MPPAPALSVVIPAFNAASFLAEALASALGEADGPMEIIVVDDASLDETVAITAGFSGHGVRCIRRPAQGGAGAARNSGIAEATGRHLAFLDADDRWPAGRMRALRKALEQQPAPDIVFGHVRQFSSSPRAANEAGPPPAIMPGFVAGAMLLTLEQFRRIGPFDESLHLGEFIDWLARARLAGLTEALIGDVVLERRSHGENLTVRDRVHFADYARVLKRSLDRKRKAPTGE